MLEVIRADRIIVERTIVVELIISTAVEVVNSPANNKASPPSRRSPRDLSRAPSPLSLRTLLRTMVSGRPR